MLGSAPERGEWRCEERCEERCEDGDLAKHILRFKLPAPSANLSYVDAQTAAFKKRRKDAQAARDAETAAKSM